MTKPAGRQKRFRRTSIETHNWMIEMEQGRVQCQQQPHSQQHGEHALLLLAAHMLIEFGFSPDTRLLLLLV